MPKGDLPSTFQFPLTIAARGLPDKVMPGESFQIPVSIAIATGVRFAIGSQQFDLDSVVPFALSSIPQEIDLRPIIGGVVCTIASVVVDGVTLTVCLKAISPVLAQIKLSLLNQLAVNGQLNGPGVIQNSALNAWFGKSATMTVTINQDALRRQQLTIGFASSWVVSLYLDFQKSVYDTPIIGSICAKIRDALHLPWQPSLTLAQSVLVPSMSSTVFIPDFQLNSGVPAVTLSKGQSTSVTIGAEAIDEFDAPISLTTSEVPGIEAVLSPSEISTQSSATLTLTALAEFQPQQLLVMGTGGGKTHSLPITIDFAKPTTLTQSGGNQGSTEFGLGLLALIIVSLLVFLAVMGLFISRNLSRVTPPRTERIGEQPPAPSPSSFYQQIVMPMAPPADNFQRWFCRYCGRDIDSQSRFCCYCGYNLE
jgi:hypothetical protein